MPLNRKIAYVSAWEIKTKVILLEVRKKFPGGRGFDEP